MDCYLPESHNLLEAAPRFDSKLITPEYILDRMEKSARCFLDKMLRGEMPWVNVVPQLAVFVVGRRVVRIALNFLVLNNRLVPLPPTEALRSIGLQLNAIWN